MPAVVTETLPGDVILSNQAGIGVRMATVDATGKVGNQAISGGGNVIAVGTFPNHRLISGFNNTTQVRQVPQSDGGAALAAGGGAQVPETGQLALLLAGSTGTAGGGGVGTLLTIPLAANGSLIAAGQITTDDGAGNVAAFEWRLVASTVGGVATVKSFVIKSSTIDALLTGATIGAVPAGSGVAISVDSTGVAAAPALQWVIAGTGAENG